MDIRRAAGIDPGSRRNQEKVFQLVMKLLPLCSELNIDPARELKVAETEKEALRYVSKEIDRETFSAHPRGKKRRKKKAVSPIPARGNESS
jgi:hypothetical protein